jgi:hypothetical protein
MIQCGSYTGNGVDANSTNEINLGWEPQWVMVKNASGSGGWYMQDTMRGLGNGLSTHYWLQANESADEKGPGQNMYVTPTGFLMRQDSGGFNANGQEYIYMAIRRPNKPAEEFEPEELFNTVSGRDDGKSPSYELGFPTDMAIQKAINGSADGHYIFSRPTGNKLMFTNESSAESTGSSVAWDYMNGVMDYFDSSAYNAWGWRRAPGFFDVVTYEGNYTQNREIPHNLGVEPEMVWIKRRTEPSGWIAYLKEIDVNPELYYMQLNEANGKKPDNPSLRTLGDVFTDTVFSVGVDSASNFNNQGYVAYLFASVPGICDIGTYTGNSTFVDVDCGFTSGPRFVLIKRSNEGALGDWMFFDTLRGISDDTQTGYEQSPMLKLNTTDAQVEGRNFISPNPEGFRALLADTTNIDGAEYIYMAIAN